MVPLIISVPGKRPAVCSSFAELLDLYPTVSSLCGLEVPERLQGRDLSPTLDDPKQQVRDTAFCVNGRGFLLRDQKWAYIQYGEDAARGVELFDMTRDPQQITNLAKSPAHRAIVQDFREKLTAKLKSVRDNDLPKRAAKKRSARKAKQPKSKVATQKDSV